jgi:hypothetical protein
VVERGIYMDFMCYLFILKIGERGVFVNGIGRKISPYNL